MIASPLNYVGNKYKLLNQILPLFPSQINHFVDVFCGSGVVGINASKKILSLNDIDFRLIELFGYFKNNDIESILNQIQEIIESFNLTDSKAKINGYYKIYKNEGLSRYNKEAFLNLRNSYNKNPHPIKLFVLILFGFNHFLRFNAKNEFNVPVGKGDFSNAQVQKTIKFIESLRHKNIILSNLDFECLELDKTGDFFYFDPPYLISDAPYNSTWNLDKELRLYEILNYLDSKKIKFALSNVLFSNGKENKSLEKFSKKYSVISLQKDYLSANYRRKNLGKTKEVLIINY